MLIYRDAMLAELATRHPAHYLVRPQPRARQEEMPPLFPMAVRDRLGALVRLARARLTPAIAVAR